MRWPTITWQGKLVGGGCFPLQHMASVPGEYKSPANSCVLWRAMTMTAVPRESRTEAPLTSSQAPPTVPVPPTRWPCLLVSHSSTFPRHLPFSPTRPACLFLTGTVLGSFKR